VSLMSKQQQQQQRCRPGVASKLWSWLLLSWHSSCQPHYTR
jgi:hypothetical protein